jgi:uncharacterized protein (TIGR02246 family)
MCVKKPEDFHPYWMEVFNSGNFEAALELFEQEATFVVQPGQVIRGKEAIGQALQDYFAMKARLELQKKVLVKSTNLALLISDWTLANSDNSFTLTGQTADVLRRQAGGNWLLAIDNPCGSQGLVQ